MACTTTNSMAAIQITDSMAGLQLSDFDSIHSEIHCLDSKPSESDSESGSLNILDLPPEILLRIFVHIDIRTIATTVIITCKRFYEILSEKDIWKTIFSLKWQGTKLARNNEYMNSWKSVYFTYDDIYNYWMQKGKWKLECKQLHGHSAPIDAVHIMPGSKLALSGSRDRNVIVWDIEDFSLGNETNGGIKEALVLSGHTGWVWSVTNDAGKPTEVITGSWDKRVMIWDLSRNGENIETYRYHPSAILTLSSDNGLIYTGSYDKKVRCFDPRSGDVTEITQQKGPILSLIVDNQFILTGSEDKTINICDRRMTPYPVSSIGVGSGILCMNLSHNLGFNYLRVGGLNGMLHTYDTTNQSFVLLDSHQLWQGNKVLKLENYYGALVACASTGYFKAYTPDRGLKLLGTYHEHSLDVSSVFSRKDIMITGADTVCLWKYRKIED